MKVLPGKIREVRQTMGVSQERLGELLGAEKRTVGRWESGAINPRLPTLEALAELSGKPLSWFFTEEAVADDRPPYVQAGVLSIGDVLLEALRQQLDEPTWTEEGAATHQGELLARARQRLGINQEIMGDQVLGWGKRRLAQVEKGQPVGSEELTQYRRAQTDLLGYVGSWRVARASRMSVPVSTCPRTPRGPRGHHASARALLGPRE